jgi:hypothetical protein
MWWWGLEMLREWRMRVEEVGFGKNGMWRSGMGSLSGIYKGF